MRGGRKSSAANLLLPSLKAFDKLSFFKLLLIRRKLGDEFLPQLKSQEG
jgi:hypothetical protein